LWNGFERMFLKAEFYSQKIYTLLSESVENQIKTKTFKWHFKCPSIIRFNAWKKLKWVEAESKRYEKWGKKCHLFIIGISFV